MLAIRNFLNLLACREQFRSMTCSSSGLHHVWKFQRCSSHPSMSTRAVLTKLLMGRERKKGGQHLFSLFPMSYRPKDANMSCTSYGFLRRQPTLTGCGSSHESQPPCIVVLNQTVNFLHSTYPALLSYRCLGGYSMNQSTNFCQSCFQQYQTTNSTNPTASIENRNKETNAGGRAAVPLLTVKQSVSDSSDLIQLETWQQEFRFSTAARKHQLQNQ